MPEKTLPTYLTLTEVARVAGVKRFTVVALVLRRAVLPDAELQFGDGAQPLFLPARAVDIAERVGDSGKGVTQSKS